MLDTILSDVGAIFEATFLQGDVIALAIALGSVLVAALMMQRGTQIGSMTLLALVLFAVGGFIRGVFRGPDATSGEATGGRAASQVEVSWMQFMDMQAGMLLAYFIAFMVLILVVYGVKSMVSGGGH